MNLCCHPPVEPSRQISRQRLLARVGLLALGWLLLSPGQSWGQNSSLFSEPLPLSGGVGQSLPNMSWTYRQLPPPREVRLHDIIMIRVEEKSQSLAEGSVERRKNGLYDAQLKDWVVLDGLRSVKPLIQPEGDPRLQGQLNQLLRAESEIETRERMAFNIAAEIVDIRPNGNLVLEAHKTVYSNDDTWEYSLSGICRREDVLPNNTVLSENIAELRVLKQDRGNVRDGYRRGWFLRWFDRFDPF